MQSKPTTDPTRSLIAGRRFRLLLVYRVVARILLSYGTIQLLGKVRGTEWKERALLRIHRLNAGRVRDLILEVQGLFIKVGQLLSVLASFLPAEFRAELEVLQDHIPARSYAEIRASLNAQLGNPDTLFADFDPEPVAAASLAQVHAARLSDGRRVAVKVRHRDIEALAHLDLLTIRRVLGIVQWALGIRGLTEVFREVSAMIAEELDFTREADNVAAVAAILAEEPGVSCPEVIAELSTSSILTTSFVDGLKISDIDELRSRGFDPAELAERILHAYCRMIFGDGPYHADPHPGNLLVRHDGEVVFIDFGAVSSLSPALRGGIPQFLESVLKRDQEGIVAALKRMGFISRRHQDADEVAERVSRYFYNRLFEEIEIESWNLKDIHMDLETKLEVMADLARLDVSIRDFTSTFQLPREWILLQRTMLLLLGLCTQLDPGMRPMQVVRPYLEEFVLGKDRDWVRLVASAVKDMALAALTLPDDLRRTIRKAERGEIEMRVRGFSEGVSLLYTIGQQLVCGILGLGTGALGYLASSRGDDDVATALFGACAVCGLFLGLSLYRGRRWQKRLRARR